MSGVNQLPKVHNVHKTVVTTSSMTPRQRYDQYAKEMTESGHWTKDAEATAKLELAEELKAEAKSTCHSISESEGGSSSNGTLAQEEKREEDEDEEDNEYEPPHKVTKLSQKETTDEDNYWIFLDYYDIPIHISKTIDSDSFHNFMHDQAKNTVEQNIMIQRILKQRSKGTTDLERGNIINFFFTTIVALEKKEAQLTTMSGTFRQVTSGIDRTLGTICNESNSEGESRTTTVYDRYDVGGQLQEDRARSTFYMHNLRPKNTDSSAHATARSLVAYDPEAPVFEPDDPHANMIPSYTSSKFLNAMNTPQSITTSGMAIAATMPPFKWKNSMTTQKPPSPCLLYTSPSPRDP